MPKDKTNAAEYAAQWDQQRDLEFWKHFASTGAIDKNTMITTVSWLLGFAGAAIAYIVTADEMLDSTFSAPRHPWGMMAVSLGGLVVSAVAGYVTLLYGGYTNMNWAMADEIAEVRHWRLLLPQGMRDLRARKRGRANRLADAAWTLAEPCDPMTELAPVFTVYWCLAVLAGLIHGGFFVWSLVVLEC